MEKVLPIGSIVQINGFEKKIMIVGLFIQDEETGKIWDYAAVTYPEGFLGAEYIMTFDEDQIIDTIFLGYETAEQKDYVKELNDRVEEIALEMLADEDIELDEDEMDDTEYEVDIDDIDYTQE